MRRNAARGFHGDDVPRAAGAARPAVAAHRLLGSADGRPAPRPAPSCACTSGSSSTAPTTSSDAPARHHRRAVLRLGDVRRRRLAVLAAAGALPGPQDLPVRGRARLGGRACSTGSTTSAATSRCTAPGRASTSRRARCWHATSGSAPSTTRRGLDQRHRVGDRPHPARVRLPASGRHLAGHPGDPARVRSATSRPTTSASSPGRTRPASSATRCRPPCSTIPMRSEGSTARRTHVDSDMTAEDIRFRIAAARRILHREGCDSNVGGHVSVRGSLSGRRRRHLLGHRLRVLRPDDAGADLPPGLRPQAPDRRARDVAGGELPRPHLPAPPRRQRDRPPALALHLRALVDRGAPSACTTSRSVLFHEEQATYFDDGVKSHLAVVDALGDKRVVLMKNHGAIVASDSLENATIEALTLESCARYHLECEAAGGTEILEAEVRRRKGHVPQALPAAHVGGEPRTAARAATPTCSQRRTRLSRRANPTMSHAPARRAPPLSPAHPSADRGSARFAGDLRTASAAAAASPEAMRRAIAACSA